VLELRRFDRDFECAKLASLEALEQSDLNPAERKALIDRIARQHAAVGYWHVSKKQYALAHLSFAKAIKHGRLLGGMKGVVMTMLAPLGLQRSA